MRAPCSSTSTTNPSATSARQASCRGRHLVLTVIHILPWLSTVTKFAGGRETPSTSTSQGASAPWWSRRHIPPASPRLASRNEPSAFNATPLGRSSIPVFFASHTCWLPSARTTATPPRQSGTNTSPAGVPSTHSGRWRPRPTASKDRGRVTAVDIEFSNVYGDAAPVKPRGISTMQLGVIADDVTGATDLASVLRRDG